MRPRAGAASSRNARLRELILHGSAPLVLARVAAPLVVAGQLAALVNVATTFWLGRLCGTAGLGVAATMAPVEQVLASLFMVVAMGGASLVARSVGARSGDGLRITASAALLATACALALALAGFALRPMLARLLAGHLDVAPELSRYLVPFLLGLPAFAAVWVLAAAVGATGWTELGTLRMFLSLVATFGLAPLCIRVFGLGVAGAATATALVLAADAVLLAWVIHRQREPLGLGALPAATVAPARASRLRRFLGASATVAPARASRLRRFLGASLAPLYDPPLWSRIVAIGAPVQLGRLAQFLAAYLLVRIVTGDGRVATAGFGVAFRLLFLGGSVTYAFGRAGAILIGQCMGARQPRRAMVAFATALAFTTAISLALALLAPLSRPLVRQFTDDPAVVDAALRALGTVRWALVGISTWQLLGDSYTATGAARLAGLVMLLSDVAAVVLAHRLAGSGLDRAALSLCVQHLAKAALLALLVERSLRRPLYAAAARPA